MESQDHERGRLQERAREKPRSDKELKGERKDGRLWKMELIDEYTIVVEQGQAERVVATILVVYACN